MPVHSVLTPDAGRLGIALADRYRIERELGQGGMATVYLAEDVKHKRKVALKVLKPELAAVLGAARFVQEITTTAALQHPHILPLFDSGEADGFLYYVMPFVDGETLRAKLDRETQLGVEEAVKIATDVAEALHYAHQRGIIHRDIKPENILLANGRPMVADFGIALAVSAAAGGRMTETGLSLGTPHYMSPEQATAEKEITARSDIYSLGTVLYEMLTGEPPHMGNSAQQIIMKIITEPAAPVTQLRKSVPPHVAAAVATALEKLPADRFATASEFADTLQGRRAAPPTRRAQAAVRGAREWRAATVGVTLVAVALAAWVVSRRVPVPSLLPVQFVVTAKGIAEPIYTLSWPATMSPDSRTIAYAGATGNGTFQYFARDVGRLESRPIPGTVGASMPLFSPNGEWFAFQAQDGRIKKVRAALDGGAPIRLVDYNDGNGMAWSPNGTMVVGAGVTSLGLSSFPKNGGPLTPLTKPDTAGLWHIWPVFLADGRTIVFTLWNQLDRRSLPQLAITSLDDGVVHPIGVRAARPLGVSGDYLVYLGGDGVVMATRFDLGHFRTQGSAVALVDSIPMCPTCNGDATVNLSSGGALTFMRGSARGRLIWMDRNHTEQSVGLDAATMLTPRLSPDDGKIAVEVDANGRKDIWIYQLVTKTMNKLTTAGDNSDPEWAPDGRSIQFLSNRTGKTTLWRQPIDGSGDAEEILVAASGLEWGATLSPDRRNVMLQSSNGGAINLYSATVGTDGVQHVFVAGDQNVWGARFSPSGKSVAYVSDESGSPEVYVRSFPSPGARVQVSTAGGMEPVWSRDGLHLYYTAGNQLIGATLSPEPNVSVVSRDSLFTGPFFATMFSQASYDVARDGRVLMIRPNDDHLQLVVTLNWAAQLAARVGTP